MADESKSAPSELTAQLCKPPPSNCYAEELDFAQIGMPGYSGSFAMMIHNMLSPAECAALLSAAESSFQWEQAMVNVGNGKQRLITDQRNCGRILWDSPEIVSALGDRIKRYLPADVMTLNNRVKITGNGPVKRGETWQMTRLNERLRFLKYSKGMYFREHCDGSYVTPDGSEITFLTVHIYLNTQSTEPVDYKDIRPDHEKPLIGGATRFSTFGSDNVYDVNPTTGSCLVFQHRSLMHSGEEVDQGTKYTVRTDILFKKVDQ